MAERSTVHGFEAWTIRAADGSLAATFVPELGGIGSSIEAATSTGPRELLFRHPFFWDRDAERTRGGWPLLFPICGRLERDGAAEAYLLDGRRRRLPIHGFSLRRPWEVARADAPDVLEMRLLADERTREAYPFEFEVRVAYRAAPRALACSIRVANRGATPMPYYAGLHPYFATPEPGAGKESAVVELRPRRRLVYNARLTDVADSAAALRFPAGIASEGVNESLHEVEPGSAATLRLPGGPALALREDLRGDARFRFVQLYTMPERPFFCVEPWMSHPNALNTAGAPRWVAPGEAEESTIRLDVSG